MTLGALFDLGVPVEVVTGAIEKLGLGNDRVSVSVVKKSGMRATNVQVRDDPGPGTSHDHDHRHDHHHRKYRDIVAMIDGAGLGADTVRRAQDMFARVARAEAHMHGVAVDEVAFHEVGAIDSIVDLVGTAAALAWLAPVSVTASSVAMGHGTVKCAHGLLPVPSPASLEILAEAGGVMVDGGVAKELCTPTGAAMLAASVTAWTPAPPMVPIGTGYGAGNLELADRPNLLRVTAGRPVEGTVADMIRVEANVDDMSPEMCEHAAAAAVAAGAVDVWWTPITMKKTRPALLVTALAAPAAADAVASALFRETTTIGVRFETVQRRALDRSFETVDTEFGQVPIKVARLAGAVVNAAPEYEVCRDLARQHGVALKQVYSAAVAAWHRLSTGR